MTYLFCKMLRFNVMGVFHREGSSYNHVANSGVRVLISKRNGEEPSRRAYEGKQPLIKIMVGHRSNVAGGVTLIQVFCQAERSGQSVRCKNLATPGPFPSDFQAT
jgi:hypothetical protein